MTYEYRILNWFHELQIPRENKAFAAWQKIHSNSQIFRYSWSIFCLPYRPNFSGIFDLCLNWVSIEIISMSNENQLYYSFWEFSWNTHLEISSVKILLTYLLLQWHGHIMSYISSRKWIHVCTLALIAICVWDLWDTKHANCCIAHPLLLHNGSKTVFKTHFDFWKHLPCISFNFCSLFDL